MYKVIGTCSICGGAVAIPTAWLSVLPPTPRCLTCGATQKKAHGPVIEMERNDPYCEKQRHYWVHVGKLPYERKL